MSLLHWCTVSPQGPSQLAAIRFSTPIRVSCLRIFPSGSHPFATAQDVVATTEPDSFFLDVYFNALPIRRDSKDKQHAPNALIPTTIAYAGGQAEFTVDIGTEYTTRLMIIKGEFDFLSIAVYGEIVLESAEPLDVDFHEPLPIVHSRPLAQAVDPGNASDPSALAESLLSLLSDVDRVPLHRVVRYMLCIKPATDDWDLEGFPGCYNTSIEDEFVLEKVPDYTLHLDDDISDESLTKICRQAAELLENDTKNANLSLFVKFLKYFACHPPRMIQCFLDHVDLAPRLSRESLDMDILDDLLECAANANVARYFLESKVGEILKEIPIGDGREMLSTRLATRIEEWRALDDAMSDVHADRRAAASLVLDVGKEETSLGIWLHSMITADRIAPATSVLTPPLFTDVASWTYDEFLCFLRAFVGVASVIAVFCWADSVAHFECLERALGILRLWQGVDGYREIVNHLFGLRQCGRRLRWIITDDKPPRRVDILAEQILAVLELDPPSVVNNDLTRIVLALVDERDIRLTALSEAEFNTMNKLALVSEDGVPAAVDEVMYHSSHPLSFRRLRTLRVSLDIIRRKLDAGAEWDVLESLWKDTEQRSHGIVLRFVELLVGIAQDLNAHFALDAAATSPSSSSEVVEHLLLVSVELLHLICMLAPGFPLTSRALRALTVAIADIFACAGFVSSSAVLSFSRASGMVRTTCLDAISVFSSEEARTESGRIAAEIVLLALLEHSSESAGRDPEHHFVQVFNLVDHIFSCEAPMDVDDGAEPSLLCIDVLPAILKQFQAYFQQLNPGRRIQILGRVVRLDAGVTGIGQWLLCEELKHLKTFVQALPRDLASRTLEVEVDMYRISLVIQTVTGLSVHSDPMSRWVVSIIASTSAASDDLSASILELLERRVDARAWLSLPKVLDECLNGEPFDARLAFALGLSLLSSMQCSDDVDESAFCLAVDLLKGIPIRSTDFGLLNPQVGLSLHLLAGARHTLSEGTLRSVLKLLEWLVEHKPQTLVSISASGLANLFEIMEQGLLGDHSRVDAVRMRVSAIDDDEPILSPQFVLPDSLSISLDDLDGLRDRQTRVPSTPQRSGDKTPDVFGVVISPPTAVLRSPAATGLTKTYLNNDFRHLRQVSASMQNTSRLPSTHVDDFPATATDSPVAPPMFMLAPGFSPSAPSI